LRFFSYEKIYIYILKNKQLGVCLQKKVSVICTALLMIVVAISTVNFVLAADSTSPAQSVQAATASGNGWINSNGKRDDFSFNAARGTLKPDGWRYNPNAQASFTGRDFKGNQLIQVWSTRVWRFKINPVDGGKQAVIAGIATVKVGAEAKGNWWFRITAKDAEKDNFMIQLWRPIGSVNMGGWSPGDFKPDNPASLKLNSAPAYQVQGILKGGAITIKP
jgi:hypothetical protein